MICTEMVRTEAIMYRNGYIPKSAKTGVRFWNVILCTEMVYTEMDMYRIPPQI